MISRSMHFAQILPGRGLFRAFGEKGMHRRDSCQPGPRCRRNARDGDAGGVRWAQCGWGARHDGRGADADGGAAGWARYGQGPNGTTPTMILDLLDTGTARREWRRAARRRWGSASAGGGTVPKTEGHAGAWAQWSRAARCRRCDEGQCSAEIAVGAGGAVGAGPGLGWRWSGPGGAGKRASVDAMHRRGRQLFAQAGKHRRNALLQRFDELLVHFEHLLQIGRRSIFPRDSPC